MADLKISQMTSASSMGAGDVFSIVIDITGTPANRKITNKKLFGAVPSNTIINGTFEANTANVRFSTQSTPANSTANGVHGQIKWDSTYLYVCTSNNNWKRIALQSF